MVKTSKDLGVSPGMLADAHLVARAVGGRYLSWNKDIARRKVLASLKKAEPTMVLDLWGGGHGAKALLNYGLPVLSVDDGRSFEDFAVSKPRGRRAMEICGAEAGYETGWGGAARFAKRCDAAFLDFMGHWSPDVASTLIACRHMKALAVTLMPERTPLGKLSSVEWEIAYRALLEHTTGMEVRWVHHYIRNSSNQRASVFFLRSRGSTPCIDCGLPNPGLRAKRCAKCIALAASQKAKNNRDSAQKWKNEHRDELLAKAQAFREAHRVEYNERARLYRLANLDRIREQERARSERRRAAGEYTKRWQTIKAASDREERLRKRREWYSANRDRILAERRLSGV